MTSSGPARAATDDCDLSDCGNFRPDEPGIGAARAACCGIDRTPRRLDRLEARRHARSTPAIHCRAGVSTSEIRVAGGARRVQGERRRLFLGDLRGRVYSFPDDPDCKKADLALELAKVHPDLSALYGLVFHPEFDKKRLVYICYVRKNDTPDGSIVSRFTMSQSDPLVIDPTSEQVLLRFYSGGHNGGCLQFGNDGYLYISTGDAAAPSPPDVMMTGQDCSDLLSSVLRIDVDHADKGMAYRVPADNPFVSMAGVRPEIWAFGFRNPWKMSFDRADRRPVGR